MADQPTPDSATPAPAPDTDALAAALVPAFKQQMQAAMASMTPPPAPVYQAPAPVQPAADPLRDLINPYVEPALRRAELSSASAMDAATFYATTPEAAQYRVDIENAFAQAMRQGAAMPRSDIWAWYQGKHMDKFAEERTQRAQAAAAAAAQGVTAGDSAGGRAGTPAGDPWTMPMDELRKRLDGVSF